MKAIVDAVFDSNGVEWLVELHCNAMEWLVSSQGQHMIEQCGYTPIK